MVKPNGGVSHRSSNQSFANSNPDVFQIDLLGLLKRKFWLILFFVVLCLALSILFYFKAPKTYESWARIYIDDRKAPTMAIEGEQSEGSSVEKYIEIIGSSSVLAEAIEQSGPDKLESLASAEDVLRFVRDNLKANPSDTKSASGVIKLRFQSQIKEDCQPILENVLLSFDNFIKKGSQDKGGDILTTMSTLEKERTERFTELMQKITVLMQKPYIQVIDGQVYNQYEGQASKLQEQLDINASEKLRFSALGDNLENARRNGASIEDIVVDTIQDMNEAQLGGYTATHQKYLDLRVREKELTGEFGADYPELKNIRQQIMMVDGIRKEQLLSALRSTSGVSEGSDFYTVVRSHIDNKLKFLDSHEKQLMEAIDESKNKSLEIAKDCQKLSMYLSERDLLTDNSFAMKDVVQEYSVMSDFERLDVRIIDPASSAEQVAPKLPLCLAAGLFLGGFLGLFYSAVKELAEKTFRSSDDVTKQLGVNVVAQIPKFDKRRPKDTEFTEITGDLITLHSPQSQIAEAFKALRTSVFFRAKQQKGMKVIQITSPTAGDGKSVISSNLAVVMAQAGRRVLLIDCDLRRQTQHHRMGVGNHVGVTSIISGECDLEGAVQNTCVKNLDILASGPPCGNPAEILISDDFAALINDTRDKYDFVIVDTPPVLPVTDPAIICSLVDAVYMPMRIRKGVQIKSQKAIEMLAMVGCEVAGVVINGLSRKEAGSYDYGGYGYGGYAKYGAYRSALPIDSNNSAVDTVDSYETQS